jgi:hypothetical protein
MSAKGLPSVIQSSEDAYRMYKALSEESAAEGRSRKKEPVFPSYVHAFLTSAALGILSNSRQPKGNQTHQLIRGEYLKPHYEPYRQLVKSKFNSATDKEVLEILIEFSEAGIRMLFDEFKKTGKINFVKLQRLASEKS